MGVPSALSGGPQWWARGPTTKQPAPAPDVPTAPSGRSAPAALTKRSAPSARSTCEASRPGSGPGGHPTSYPSARPPAPPTQAASRRGGGISACARHHRAHQPLAETGRPTGFTGRGSDGHHRSPGHRSADSVRRHRGHSCSRRGLNRVRARPVVATDENRTRRRPRLQRSGPSPFDLQVPRLVEIRLLSTRCEHGRVFWIPDP